MRPEFHYTRNDFTADFEAICGTADSAKEVLAEFHAICGVPLKREEDTLTFTIGLDRLEEAIITIENAGYSTVDLVARDTDYAIQEHEFGREDEES